MNQCSIHKTNTEKLSKEIMSNNIWNCKVEIAIIRGTIEKSPILEKLTIS